MAEDPGEPSGTPPAGSQVRSGNPALLHVSLSVRLLLVTKTIQAFLVMVCRASKLREQSETGSLSFS